MSYIRGGTVYQYVEGDSKDYIFSTGDEIVDYDHITNETLIEFLAKIINDNWCINDKVLHNYLITHLAVRLNVKLRKQPISEEEAFKLQSKDFEEWKKTKEYEELFGGE